MMPDSRYVPGVCNIGSKEAARRRIFGHLGLAISVVLFLVLWRTHVNPLWRLVLFIPATMAAAGYLQAQNRFCFAYSGKGVYNFDAPGQVKPVPDDASKRKDRRRGNQLLMNSILIGIMVAVLTIVLFR